MNTSISGLLRATVVAASATMAIFAAATPAAAQTSPDDIPAPEILEVLSQDPGNTARFEVRQGSDQYLLEVLIDGEVKIDPEADVNGGSQLDTLYVDLWGLERGADIEVSVRHYKYGTDLKGPTDTFTLTTPPSNDTEPPAAPRDVTAQWEVDILGTPYIDVNWASASDDTDPTEDIDHYIQVDNGAPRAFIRQTTGTELYAGGSVFTVWAVDTSNNESDKTTIQLPAP